MVGEKLYEKGYDLGPTGKDLTEFLSKCTMQPTSSRNLTTLQSNILGMQNTPGNFTSIRGMSL